MIMDAEDWHQVLSNTLALRPVELSVPRPYLIHRIAAKGVLGNPAGRGLCTKIRQRVLAEAARGITIQRAKATMVEVV